MHRTLAVCTRRNPAAPCSSESASKFVHAVFSDSGLKSADRTGIREFDVRVAAIQWLPHFGVEVFKSMHVQRAVCHIMPVRLLDDDLDPRGPRGGGGPGPQ